MTPTLVPSETAQNVPGHMPAGPGPAQAKKMPRRRALWRSLRDSTREGTQLNSLWLSLWLTVHVFLGIACAQLPLVAQLHALLVLCVGLWYAVSGKHVERVIYAAAYLVGAEALWRMTKAPIFYEYGKYALALILLVATLRRGYFRGNALALLYFALLLPSVILPSAFIDTAELRDAISFNLSGPFALALSVWFLSQATLNKAQVLRTLFCMLTPTISIACVATFRLSTAETVVFGQSSSKLGSGGFGPNQVSAALGLGIICALLYILLEKRERWLKVLLIGVIGGLASQAALTFSRTGLYLGALSSLVAFVCLLREPRARLQFIAVGLALFLIGNYVLLPRLDSLTDGALTKRFANTKTTGRDQLLADDLKIWGNNPVFGTGPGLAKELRSIEMIASHTEYSRLLAEHGSFGLLALFCLTIICFVIVKQIHDTSQRAFVLSLLAWALLFMAVSAMRLAAPSFVLGLTAIRWRPTEPARHT